ncbi:Flavodoxin [Arthrobacter sp. 9AX]|uniref:flavodoxin domain-containing protein n=1 Tax=Arthrobacter sp. 9AX TaxID=2653131 RepID=UPI0012F300E1|nr:flavodoxin domain-containing protein [Arthrobacter sp. 9AX]VXC23107.1 Flavodoxin [Arthrobacter sp. 9AX]
MENSKATHALVVYESIYGNTHEVANAVAEGLRESVDAVVVRAADVQRENLAGIALIVAGGPTHGHGLSRPQLREAGVKGAVSAGEEVDPGAEGPWLREWLTSLDPRTAWATSFDTRYDAPELLTGHASKGIMRKLEQKGLRRLAEPESFPVTGQNQLLPGELERARVWGRTLGHKLQQAAPSSVRPSYGS